MITSAEANQLLKKHISKSNLLKHCYAVGAIMRGLGEELGENADEWEICGLVHDVDFAKTEENPAEHGILAEDILSGKVSEEIIHAIKAHNFEYTGVKPESKMDNGLIAADAISGLVIACTLVYPSKKIADVKLKSVSKRFKARDFARACNRENMLYCEKIGIEKARFFEISLESLKKVSDELGL